MKTEKKFAWAWDQASYDNCGEIDRCGIDAFTDENGYPDEEIAIVKALEVGQGALLDGGYHMVLRIE